MQIVSTSAHIEPDAWPFIGATAELSQRELEIAQLLCANTPRKLMPNLLHCSRGAVNKLCDRVYKKTGRHTPLALYTFCEEIAARRKLQESPPQTARKAKRRKK